MPGTWHIFKHNVEASRGPQDAICCHIVSDISKKAILQNNSGHRGPLVLIGPHFKKVFFSFFRQKLFSISSPSPALHPGYKVHVQYPEYTIPPAKCPFKAIKGKHYFQTIFFSPVLFQFQGSRVQGNPKITDVQWLS